ncbi:MAG: hypothetical protein IKX71_03455 [Bacteroidales bacterium]|nr:hypothetical protein [Bacteroidales bacterium]
MNDQQLDSFLKENKPRVESDPTFTLEARRRMAEVEGIKAEVDRTRRSGRVALIVALVSGIILGAVASAVAFLWPIDPAALEHRLLDTVRTVLEPYKNYILFFLALMITALCLVLTSGRKQVLQ